MYLNVNLEYKLDISIFFWAFFILGALFINNKITLPQVQYKFTFSKSLQIGLILLSLLYVSISFSHGLYNRRLLRGRQNLVLEIC